MKAEKMNETKAETMKDEIFEGSKHLSLTPQTLNPKP
jgi:hypothetical protein